MNTPVPGRTTTRRGLLRAMAWATAAPSALRLSLPAAIPPAPPMPADVHATAPVVQLGTTTVSRGITRVLLQNSPVAGFQFHDGEAVWPFLRTGDPLALVREPHNRFDARAVRLEWEGRKIGYVPASDNAAISQLLDRGESLDAVLTRLRESRDPWSRVGFAVYLAVA